MERQNERVRIIPWLKEHFWGIVLIVVLAVVSNFGVRAWKAKHPGAMTVIEAQAMDMTAMKPPVGAVPVATEIARRSSFSGRVTYTGSVAPYTEQNIYPRVEGWLKSLAVYNGDRVPAGKIIAVIDSPDLRTRVSEASAGRSAAQSAISVARTETSRMAAEWAAAEHEARAARNDLEAARARLSAMRRNVIRAEKELKSARANLEYWHAEIRREENLLGAGAVSLQEYQSEKAQAIAAEAEVENKQAAVEEARENVRAMEAEVSARQAMVEVAERRAAAARAALESTRKQVDEKSAMARQAGAALATAAIIDSYRNIRAPFGGLVTKRYISPGQFVRPSDAILNLVQIDRVRLQANVADKDLSRIRIGASVVARPAKDPSVVYHTSVSSISPLADQESRTAIIEAIVENPNHRLVPGDFVTMEIATSFPSEQITVPISAVVRKNERDAVWIVRSEGPRGNVTYYCTMHPEVTSDKPGTCPKCHMELVPKVSGGNKRAHLVYVTLGESDGNQVEVLAGIKEGDEVIYRGHTYLKEGDIVFPTAWGEEGPRQLPPGSGGEMTMPGMGHEKHGSNKRQGAPEMDHEMMPGMEHPKKSQVSARETPPMYQKSRKVYTCPMHPEIISHKKGDTCPKCGMYLVEKKPAKPTTESHAHQSVRPE